MLNSRKIMKIVSTLYFETPLRPNHDLQSNFFLPHDIFWEKSPTHNIVSPKLFCARTKNRRGEGLLKPPPPGSYRVNGAMHSIYYINRSNSHENRFNLFGQLTNSTQRICLVARSGREPVTFRLLVRHFPSTSHMSTTWIPPPPPPPLCIFRSFLFFSQSLYPCTIISTIILKQLL